MLHPKAPTKSSVELSGNNELRKSCKPKENRPISTKIDELPRKLGNRQQQNEKCLFRVRAQIPTHCGHADSFSFF
jgi:hypothetical protein